MHVSVAQRSFLQRNLIKVIILWNHPTSDVIIFDDCDLHNKDWLALTTKDLWRRAVRSCAVCNGSTNIIQEHAFFSRVSGFSRNLLDLFLRTDVVYYNITSISVHLGRFDHALISVTAFADVTTEVLFFFCFSFTNPSVICQEINEIIRIGICFLILTLAASMRQTQRSNSSQPFTVHL